MKKLAYIFAAALVLEILILGGASAVRFLQKPTGPYFTFIVLPDTQFYSMSYPENFASQTSWIVKNKDRLNIRFVSQLGDIVENGSLSDAEWHVASESMRILDNANIPYGIIPGNHDADRADGPDAGFTKYNEIFPPSRFSGKPWFGGNYHEYQNNYQLVDVNNIGFLFINLEVDPADDVLQWADSILSRYSDKKTVITTHAYLEDDTGQRSQRPYFRIHGNSGEDIWNKLIIKRCNVFLVLSGHFHKTTGENRLDSINNCGGTVHQVVQDYQARDNGGNGLLRIYQFYPNTHEIAVSTYSPVTNQYMEGDKSTFTLRVAF